MASKNTELDVIEAGILALHRVAFQHRAWEALQRRAGINLERANATLLKVVAMCSEERKPCRMQEIAERLGIEAPSVTRTVQELESAGLIVRQQDRQDKRVSNVRLTKKGEKQLAKLQAARRERLAEALSGWTKQDLKVFGDLLSRFAQDITHKQQQ